MVRVAVIGSGLIGRAWAVVFANAGCQVAMYDTDPGCRNGLPEAVKAECEILHMHGLLADADDLPTLLGRPTSSRKTARSG